METFMRRAAIKRTYLLVLLAFLAWMANSFAGGYFYPRGEGIVIGDPAVVAAEFNATIREILVKEGQAVSKGEVSGSHHFSKHGRESCQIDIRICSTLG